MVDTDSLYGVQERELQRRLPHVRLDVIKHFLAMYQGNLDECYQRLRTQTPQPTSSNMESFFSEVGRTATLPNLHPQTYHHRPQNDQHRDIRRQFTWDPGLHVPHQTYTHNAPYTHHQQQSSPPYSTMHGGGVGATYSMGQPSHSVATPSSVREHPSSQGVIAVNRVTAQQQQFNAICTYQEASVQHLSLMKQQVEQKQQRLSELRVEVSAIMSEQQVGELNDVIRTLEIDLREERRTLQVDKVQSQMKEEQDLYTDEGVRWYCRECSFLNHPLMTLCEKCDVPKLRSHG